MDADIVVFHVKRRVSSRCSTAACTEGAALDKAACVARLTSNEPGVYRALAVGELMRWPGWLGWNRMRTGNMVPDPKRVKIRTLSGGVETARTLAKGPYVAETFPSHRGQGYVIVEVSREAEAFRRGQA